MVSGDLGRRHLLLQMAAALLLGWGVDAGASNSFAQGYPSRPISLIVPFASGGVGDVLSRPVAEALGNALGQRVLVENKPGATGTIGAAFVQKSTPDGYTLLFGTSNELCMSPPLLPNLSYDPTKDFVPITIVGKFPNVLVVRPDFPANNVEEFIAYARQNPGKVRIASTGVGGTNHLTLEIFKRLTNTDILHIPYRGGGPALTDVMGGHVDGLFATLPSAVVHVNGKLMKALMVTDKKRSIALPDVPNAIESKIPDLVVSTFNGVLAPRGTPPEIVAQLQSELQKVIQSQAIRDGILRVGAEPDPVSSAEFAEIIRRDLAYWTEAIKAIGIKLQ